jgi:hypothetical protein
MFSPINGHCQGSVGKFNSFGGLGIDAHLLSSAPPLRFRPVNDWPQRPTLIRRIFYCHVFCIFCANNTCKHNGRFFSRIYFSTSPGEGQIERLVAFDLAGNAFVSNVLGNIFRRPWLNLMVVRDKFNVENTTVQMY